MARPRKYIDRKLLKELCQAQLTNLEIAQIVGLKFDHLEARYGVAIKAWRAMGPGRARRKLYTEAMAGNNACLIFFLKNYGGMADVSREDRPMDTGSLAVPNEFRETDKSNGSAARVH